MRERDLDAIDWEHIIEEICDLADSLRDGCVSIFTRSIRWMLQIEHYPAGPKKLKAWHERAWASRMDLHYAIKECPGLFQRDLESMLAESWQYARKIAVRKMASLDNRCGKYHRATVYEDAIWKAYRESWDREVPHKCCYAFDEIVGYNPHGKRLPGEPDPTYWPPGVQRKLREVFGPELTYAYPDRKAPKLGWYPFGPDDTIWPPAVAKRLREAGLLDGEADPPEDDRVV